MKYVDQALHIPSVKTLFMFPLHSVSYELMVQTLSLPGLITTNVFVGHQAVLTSFNVVLCPGHTHPCLLPARHRLSQPPGPSVNKLVPLLSFTPQIFICVRSTVWCPGLLLPFFTRQLPTSTWSFTLNRSTVSIWLI